MIFGQIIPGINYKNRPAAYAVITNDEGQIAAVKGWCGYFLPGGGSLPGESPEETIARELREELACDVELITKIGEAVQYFSATDGDYKMPAVFYEAKFTSEQQGKCEYELVWLDENDIAEKLFHECHKWALDQTRHQTGTN